MQEMSTIEGLKRGVKRRKAHRCYEVCHRGPVIEESVRHAGSEIGNFSGQKVRLALDAVAGIRGDGGALKLKF